MIVYTHSSLDEDIHVYNPVYDILMIGTDISSNSLLNSDFQKTNGANVWTDSCEGESGCQAFNSLLNFFMDKSKAKNRDMSFAVC